MFLTISNTYINYLRSLNLVLTVLETTTEFGQAKCRRNDCALMREMVDRLATKNVKLQQALKVQQNAIDGLAAKLATL